MKKFMKFSLIFIFIFVLCSCNKNNNTVESNNVIDNQSIVENNTIVDTQNIVENNNTINNVNLKNDTFINLNFKVPDDAIITKTSNEDFSTCKITFTSDDNSITININYFQGVTINDVYGSDEKVNKGNITLNNNTYLLATKGTSYFYFLQNSNNVYLIRYDSSIDDENTRNEFMNNVSI